MICLNCFLLTLMPYGQNNFTHFLLTLYFFLLDDSLIINSVGKIIVW